MKKDKKIQNKYVLIAIGIMSFTLVVAILITFYFQSTIATEETNIADENSIELKCNDYTSFENKLTCKVIATVASNQKVASIDVKFSSIPSTVENLIDASYESTVMEENGYVDIIFANDIVTSTAPVRVDVANVTFDNITEEKLITITEANYVYEQYNMNTISKITNPTVASKIVSYELENRPGGATIVSDKYLYLQTVHDVTNGEHITSDFNLKPLIEEQLKDIFTLAGCTYKISDDGSSLILTDNYGNNKSIKTIYVNSIDNDYMLSWSSSLNIYTRGFYTLDSISENCLETNGYFVLENDQIKLYGDNAYEDLIDTRNWLYIKSTVYNINSNVINISDSCSYDEFMSNIETHGVTVKLYDNSGNEISSGSLNKINKLEVSGVPGYAKDNITVNVDVTEYVNIKNYNVINNSDGTNTIYNVPKLTKIKDFLNNIDTNGTIKLYESNGSIITNYDNEFLNIYTNMYIDVIINGTTTRYYISVLGDLVGSGTIYLGDVVKLYKMYKNKIEFTDSEKLAGDVVKDNAIDLLDVAKLYRYYRGVESSLN